MSRRMYKVIAYWRHLRFSVQYALVLVIVAVPVLINAFIPSLFKDTGENFVRAMADAFDEVD